MAYHVEGKIGAGRYERNEERTTQRNGYRHRAFDTRLGTLDLQIPKWRKGSYFPGFLERHADIVGTFPNEASITRLVGAILLERNDEWQFQYRCRTLETMAGRTGEQPATLTHIAA